MISERYKKFHLRPFFVAALPVFYIIHTVRMYSESLTWSDILQFIIWYSAATVFFFIIFLFIFKSRFKAVLFSFSILVIHLFFGVFHDTLKFYFKNHFISRYVFVIPFLLILLTLIFVYLKKKTAVPYKGILYLNTLFFMLIVYELGVLFLSKSKQRTVQKELTTHCSPCSACRKPDIFLIVADGYPSNITLQQIFGYDNSPFTDELKRVGFFIPDSFQSNYNFTMYSIASLLNMEYLSGLDFKNSSLKDIRTCLGVIKKNALVRFLQQQGYRTGNASLFDLDGQKAAVSPSFFYPLKNRLVSNTFVYRFKRDLGYHLVSTLGIKSVEKKWLMHDFENNEKVKKKLFQLMDSTVKVPKFVYAHFNMPHWPYYFDSTGKMNSYRLFKQDFAGNTSLFLSYLKYANTEYLRLLNRILQITRGKAIILFISDHGFREYEKPVPERYHYLNLAAVYLPEKNYESFFAVKTNINLFRVLLNQTFGCRLPLLNDSTYRVID
ncbi:MAG: LTA synthase family protein [Chitinophagaceae bacterium]|nr:LTA synthase family protein [Chitinophagaceae bacterium]